MLLVWLLMMSCSCLLRLGVLVFCVVFWLVVLVVCWVLLLGFLLLCVSVDFLVVFVMGSVFVMFVDEERGLAVAAIWAYERRLLDSTSVWCVGELVCVLVGVFCTVAQHGQSYEWNAGLLLSCWLVVFCCLCC